MNDVEVKQEPGGGDAEEAKGAEEVEEAKAEVACGGEGAGVSTAEIEAECQEVEIQLGGAPDEPRHQPSPLTRPPKHRLALQSGLKPPNRPATPGGCKVNVFPPGLIPPSAPARPAAAPGDGPSVIVTFPTAALGPTTPDGAQTLVEKFSKSDIHWVLGRFLQ